jgi:hypothetical protein
MTSTSSTSGQECRWTGHLNVEGKRPVTDNRRLIYPRIQTEKPLGCLLHAWSPAIQSHGFARWWWHPARPKMPYIQNLVSLVSGAVSEEF